MLVPEDILKQQTCSSCQKYLSVGPIKVYPNRQVKCGRCSKNDNKGVESKLYNSVVQTMKFPCVNRYDGCIATCTMAEMEQHERSCRGGIYECYLCQNFEGSAYKLNIHCQQYHKQNILPSPMFWINLNHCDIKDIFYFYQSGSRLFFVRYACDIENKKATLDIIFIGMCYKGDIFYSLSLYSTSNKLLLKTKKCSCSILEVRPANRLTVNLKSLKTPLLLCNFAIHEEPEIHLEQNIPIIDDSYDSIIIRLTFKDINSLEDLGSVLDYPSTYNFKDITWKVFVKKMPTATPTFAIGIEWLDEEDNLFNTCKLSGVFTLLAFDGVRKISKAFHKATLGPGIIKQVILASWNYVTSPANGFIKKNKLKVELKLKIYIPVKKEVKCYQCNQYCQNCNISSDESELDD